MAFASFFFFEPGEGVDEGEDQMCPNALLQASSSQGLLRLLLGRAVLVVGASSVGIRY